MRNRNQSISIQNKLYVIKSNDKLLQLIEYNAENELHIIGKKPFFNKGVFIEVLHKL